MPWDDDLQPASWRGIPFVVSSDPTRAGRQVAVHGYPYREAQPVWQEDTGRAPREYAIAGYIHGDDVVQQRQAMTDAVDQQPGPGELVHPFYGSLSVVLIRFGCSARADLGRVVELTFEFVEAGAQVYPESTDDTGAQVDGAAGDAQTAASADYVNRTAPPGQQGTTAGRLLDTGTVTAVGVA